MATSEQQRQQCMYEKSHGDDGVLFCTRQRGHDGPHCDPYGGEDGDWSAGDALERSELEADNARLRKLIADAEWEGNTSREPEPACPWCRRDRYGVPREQHRDDCPAFSALGVVR